MRRPVKKVPAWAQRRARERGELVVGNTQVVWTPTDVRALIDRVNVRYRGLALAVANTPAAATEETGEGYVDPLGSEWRSAWAAQYASWLNFRESASTLWGSTAASAQAFDQELDAFRETFEERTGRATDLPSSTTATQGRQPQVPGFMSGLGIGVGGAALVGLGGLLLFGLARSR